MDHSERYFTISIELVLFVVTFGLLVILLRAGLLLAVVTSFLITHTVNWLLNGHFWALMLEARISRARTGRARLVQYSESMTARLGDKECLRAMYVFGSLSRDTPRETSDLDVRLVLARGTINRMRGCSITSAERIRAFIKHFPLDIHAVDSFERLGVMRDDEKPLIFFRHDDF